MLRLISCGCLVAVFAACGGTAIVDDHIAGSGGASSSASVGATNGTGAGGGIPDECAVSHDATGPYPVRFQFLNSSGRSWFLLQDCAFRFDVTACATGYAEPLVRSGACTAPCSGPPDCIACGACPLGGAEVPPGDVLGEDWSGLTFTFGTNASGCQCHDESFAPAAKYRVVVPVYESAESARALGMPSHRVEVDFPLPAPDGIVSIELSP